MIRLLIAVIMVLGTNLMGTPAEAGKLVMRCGGLPTQACLAAAAALERAPYVGPVRPAQEPMACARVVSRTAVPVVWVAGNEHTYDKDAPVITKTGIVHTETFSLNRNWTVTESCIPRRLLNNVSELTLCTGLHDDGFHWELADHELRNMKRTGHFDSYVPFLSDRQRNSLSKQRVEAAYRARYHTR